jgi:uncharacterized protein YbjT (DUF2867 family)
MSTNRILVTGASGNIGRELVAQLKARGADFAVMSSKAGAARVHGDFADRASLERAFKGFDTLFLLLPLVPNKVALAENAIAAAQSAGIRHIVRSSGLGADAQSPGALARLQGTIDALVAGSGIAHTFIRPAGFMQNWVNFAAAQLKAGTYHAPHGNGAQSLIDTRDIAESAAVILMNPSAHAGRAYNLTGGESLTNQQMLDIIGKAAGHPIAYVDVPESAAREAMAGMPPVMIDWFLSLHHAIKQGWAAGISDDVRALTSHVPRRLADFAADNANAWK